MYDYKEILDNIKEAKDLLRTNGIEQRNCRKGLACMQIPYNQFKVNGNFTDGNKMFDGVAKLALKSFDESCDNLISSLTISNADTIQNKILEIFTSTNEQIEPFDISIKTDYYALKIYQCEYQFELLLNQQRYKEIQKAEKEIIKEQLKEERLLEKETEKLERERADLQYKFNKKIEKQNVYDNELKEQIDGLENVINHNEFMLRHKRCGYVYVVSNNDMKEGQYKIGITRRSVEERMKELGSGASHSFPMNVHGYVYCDDCFEVENKLHKYFSDKRVNQVNNKKEWFKTTLDEIQHAFKETCNIDIELDDVADDNYLYSKNKVAI